MNVFVKNILKFKKIIIGLCTICCCFVATATTINIDWKNTDGTNYAQTTCETGSNLTLPPTPTKPGHTFAGWRLKYIPIEYIESTGTQWIDTGFASNQDTGIKTKIRFNSVENDKTLCFGSSVNYITRSFELYTWDTQLNINYASSVQIGAIHVGDIVEIDWNKNIVNYSINNILQPRVSFQYKNFTTPYPMAMFTNRRSPNVYSTGHIRIYYFKIYDDDVLVHDFIPMLDESDRPCMYDRVSKKCFYNAGTGEFIAGPAK